MKKQAVIHELMQATGMGPGQAVGPKTSKILNNIPLDYSGRLGKFRKAADYMFAPVSQVGRDIKSGVDKLIPHKNIRPALPGRVTPATTF